MPTLTPHPRIYFTTDLCNALLQLAAQWASDTGVTLKTIQLGTAEFLRVIKATAQDGTSAGLEAMLDGLWIEPSIADGELEGSPGGVAVPTQSSGQVCSIRILHARKIQSGELAEAVTWARSDSLADAIAANPQLLGCGLPTALGIDHCFPTRIEYNPPERTALRQVETFVDANAINVSITAQAPRYFIQP